MSDREFYLKRHTIEQKAFFKVIDAIPAERADYTPHERSPTAHRLLWTLAGEHVGCSKVVDTGRIDLDEVPAPPVEEARAIFKKAYVELREKAAALDDAGWERNMQAWAGGQKRWEKPLGEFLVFMFLDAIHHRGQLSTYLRPMGAKVPAIYGPSADDPEPAGLF